MNLQELEQRIDYLEGVVEKLVTGIENLQDDIRRLQGVDVDNMPD